MFNPAADDYPSLNLAYFPNTAAAAPMPVTTIVPSQGSYVVRHDVQACAPAFVQQFEVMTL